MNYNIRIATTNDIPFLVESVIEAEKAGSDIISYCSLFNINQQKLSEIINNAFTDEVGVVVWDVNTWIVLEDSQGNTIAGLASWIESDNLASEKQKFQYLNYVLRPDLNDKDFKTKISQLQKGALPRNKNSRQLDFLYTNPNFRGKGIMKMLIGYAINNCSESCLQLQVLSSNYSAIKLYEKMGFIEERRLTCNGLKSKGLLADDTKICMTYYG